MTTAWVKVTGQTVIVSRSCISYIFLLNKQCIIWQCGIGMASLKPLLPPGVASEISIKVRLIV